FCAEVDSAVHQPETASWSLSRSEEMRRPAVGSVQSATMSRTERWTTMMSGEREVAVISALHFLGGVADVPDHDRHDEDHDDDGDGGTAPEIAAAAEHPVEHQVRQNLRLPLAVRHGEHDVE